MTVPFRAFLVFAAVALLVAACGPGARPAPSAAATAPPASATPTGSATSTAPTGQTRPIAPKESARPGAPAGPDQRRKVLLIAEENHEYDQIIGDPRAPYINELARTYGIATHLDAGYPTGCPSLAAYLLLTSGDTHGVCDDQGPRAHPLTGANVFSQVAATGRQWRAYAESAPSPCALDNSRNGRYLVRHVPATYYLTVRTDCRRWAVPLGGPGAGALHDDLAAASLPAFGFVTPDACNDMHGAPVCPLGHVNAGDQWLRTWIPQILAGPDYRAGRLTIIITWDEGTDSDNHIPTLVISPTTRRITSADPYTHCSTLRTVETVLGLAQLGCAAGASSMTAAFRL